MNKTIILAAGGTGGHMFPARALAEVLRARGWRIVLITDRRGAALSDGFSAEERHVIPAASLGGKNPIRLIAGIFSLLAGIVKSLWLILRIRPALVAGFGGYPSFPALAAARLSFTPIVLHEQNCVLGRTNRVFAKRAKLIASGFDVLEKLPPTAKARHVVTGNPLRASILERMDTQPAHTGERLHLLVLGGSLGAKILGETVPAAVKLLPKSLQSRLDVVQQTREEQLDTLKKIYAEAGMQAELAPFFDDVADRLARADLVIARAGASSVAEIAAMGKASILIPLAIAMDDHQMRNAQSLAAHEAADVIAEEKLTPERLAALMAARLGNTEDLQLRGAAARSIARPEAAKTLADLIEDLG
ncbi:MAG: undecaprenyldiphospho-muramoylpentapeptide beta-N-acetylglucosaminyltransferase [Robiginitomaculum sp.]|nr:MAG: undecaprenyldiphospho-muramoylpentapeptide beta-N-acetylglucosaminyltransferase [Robiginitomaculum sp.]